MDRKNWSLIALVAELIVITIVIAAISNAAIPKGESSPKGSAGFNFSDIGTAPWNVTVVNPGKEWLSPVYLNASGTNDRVFMIHAESMLSINYTTTSNVICLIYTSNGTLVEGFRESGCEAGIPPCGFGWYYFVVGGAAWKLTVFAS